MRPGPRRSCEISKPRPSPSRMFSLGTRTFSNLMCMWPRGAWSWPNTHIGPRIFTPGAEHAHRPQDLHAGRVDGHQDLRLLELRRGVGAGLDHGDHDLAARITGAGDVVLLAIDDPVVAVELGARGDVLGI